MNTWFQPRLPTLFYRWWARLFSSGVGKRPFARRLAPISRQFGFDRGLPIDRYYIEKFLAGHAQDIRGRVLEIGDDTYTRRFGGERVTTADVLHVAPGNPQATFLGDLTQAGHIPSHTFNCLIVTQTLQFVYDVPAALGTLSRILKPGGVLLATFPGISQIAADEWGSYQCWNFTKLWARRAFEAAFPKACLHIETFGNALAAAAFLQGIAAEELEPEGLDLQDDGYQILIAVRVRS